MIDFIGPTLIAQVDQTLTLFSSHPRLPVKNIGHPGEGSDSCGQPEGGDSKEDRVPDLCRRGACPKGLFDVGVNGPLRPDPDRHPKLDQLPGLGIERARGVTGRSEALIRGVGLRESLDELFERHWQLLLRHPVLLHRNRDKPLR